MVVKLDLRITGGNHKIRVKNSLMHCAVSAAAAIFLLTSAVILTVGSLKIYSLRAEKLSLISESTVAAENLKLIDKEFARLSSEVGRVDAILGYTMGDIPAMEIMAALNSMLPAETVIRSVKVTSDTAIFNGAANNDGSVMQFAENLSGAAFSSSVEVPGVERSIINGTSLSLFSVTCKLRPLRYILAAGGSL